MAATAPMVERESPARASRGFIGRRAVLLYFALTFVIAWGGAILAALLGTGHVPATAEEFRPYLLPAMLVGFSAPAVSGLLLTWLVDGRAGLHALRTRLREWRVGARWYALALLAAPVAVLALLLPLSLNSSGFLPALFVTDTPVALLVLGLDLPLFVPEAIGWFLIVLPAYRVLLVWLHDHTGSLPVTMVMHGSLSATTGLILAPSVTGASLAAYYLAFGASRGSLPASASRGAGLTTPAGLLRAR